MKAQSATLTPSNSLVLIMDPAKSEIPASMSGREVAMTSSCIAVGTLEEHEGPTAVRMVDATSVQNEPLPPLEVADTTLHCESNSLVVSDVLGERYIEWSLSTADVRVRVYTNHSTEPDEIAIVVG
jgi:hypothetical protein